MRPGGVATRAPRSGAGAGKTAAPSPEHQQAIAQRPRGAVRRRAPTPLTPPRARRARPSGAAAAPPAALAPLCSTAPRDRAGHTYGKSFRDVVRGLPPRLPQPARRGRVPAHRGATSPPCSTGRQHRRAAAVIPYGGGSSVVGGVEAPRRRPLRAASCRSTSAASTACSRSIAPRAPRASRAASSVRRSRSSSARTGSRCATSRSRSSSRRSAAGSRRAPAVTTRRSTRTSTTSSSRCAWSRRAGVVETRRLPGSGAGPSPDRLFIGSEGILGVIIEAWMRLQDAPAFRAVGQRHLRRLRPPAPRPCAPSRRPGSIPPTAACSTRARRCRPGAGAGDDSRAPASAFESADHPLDAWMARALECARDHGGVVPAGRGRPRAAATEGDRDGAAGAWRRAFLDAPYLRDALVGMGVISETFETAVTWDRFAAFHAAVIGATERRASAASAARGTVTCRFTHVYPDGPAPYYTVIAPARPGAQLEQWAEIKAAAAEAILRQGGTITHHHAVGRDHRPWYDRERPDGFAARAARREARARSRRHAQPRRADRSLSARLRRLRLRARRRESGSRPSTASTRSTA